MDLWLRLLSGQQTRFAIAFQRPLALRQVGIGQLRMIAEVGRKTALYPVIEQLEHGLRFEKHDSAERKLDKLERLLGELNLPVGDLTPILGSLLSLPTETRYAALGLAPQELRAAIFDALLAISEAMAADETLLIVVEDAHWMDRCHSSVSPHRFRIH